MFFLIDDRPAPKSAPAPPTDGLADAESAGCLALLLCFLAFVILFLLAVFGGGGKP